MRTITIRRLDLQFDADQVTKGAAGQQADQAVELINNLLQRQRIGLGAQLIYHPDEIELEDSDEEDQ